jgi:hypothetical protein
MVTEVLHPEAVAFVFDCQENGLKDERNAPMLCFI